MSPLAFTGCGFGGEETLVLWVGARTECWKPVLGLAVWGSGLGFLVALLWASSAI